MEEIALLPKHELFRSKKKKAFISVVRAEPGANTRNLYSLPDIRWVRRGLCFLIYKIKYWKRLYRTLGANGPGKGLPWWSTQIFHVVERMYCSPRISIGLKH